MKKVIFIVGALLVFALLLVSCGDNSTGNSQSGTGGTGDPSSSDVTTETTDSSGSDTSSGTDESTDNSTNDSTTDGSGTTDGSSTTDSSNTTDSSGNEGGADEPCKQHRLGNPVTIKEPTCTEWGIKAQYCQNCDYFSERKVVPKGHEKIVDPGYPSTCVTPGMSDGAHCGVCSVTIEEKKELPLAENHLEYAFKKVIKEPVLGTSGSAVFACVGCGKERTEILAALKTETIKKADVYNVEANPENPAVDNRWYVFDGKTDTAGLWNPGSDWFGNVGDTLTVTLAQETVLTDLVLYCAGNWTKASVTVRDTAGKVVL